jgi:sulfur relay (sulfurtransferase) complex TusBCD TusD component (DsrE family)
MKTNLFFVFALLSLFMLAGKPAHSQGNLPKQKIGIVISTNDPETAWNAFRLANYSVEQGDTVSVFLLGKGVEAPTITNPDFNVKAMMQSFSDKGGKLFACGTCLQMRKTEGSKLCPVSSLDDLYTIIKTNSIVLTF